MKIARYLTAGASVIAMAAAGCLATGASARTFYPYKANSTRMNINRPVVHVGPWEAPYVAPSNARSGKWTDVKASLPFAHGPWGPMQMTDGTVIIQDYCTTPNQWYKLTPDNKGSYVNGTWSKIATMPSGYSPLFFAQQVLPDGRVIVNGGEYNASNNSCGGGTWTNKGALYDPVKDSWTSVAAPAGWSQIGDAESVILPNGTYMLASCCVRTTGQAALASINGTKVTWTIQNAWACPAGDPCMDEEGFTPLPDGNVLSVDVWNTNGGTADDTWIYNTAAGTWSQSANTSCYLSDASSFELGPAALRPDGTIINFGDNPSCNSMYNISKGKWTSAPDFPLSGYDMADAPAATLPDGNVLAQASPGVFDSPSHFFEYSVDSKGNQKITQVNDPAEAQGTSSFEGNLLVLPTGQVLWDNSQVRPNEVALYTPTGRAKGTWRPKVKSVSASLGIGSTGNAISGKNFNGFSLGGVYGDDAQASTNWPLVRITNTSTGDVCFGRSYDFSTMGVWTKGTTKAEFDIPNSCESGASTLQVIVNGIASRGVSVTLS
ncbi:MAG: hypothetical protein ACREHF_12325 [Rhizomicrobium sp.]